MPFDPTGTVKQRATFRREGQRRLQTLSRLTRFAIVEQDMLGLKAMSFGGAAIFRPASTMSNADKLRMFVDWLKGAMQTIMIGDGQWLHSHLRQAYESGQRAAVERWTKQQPSTQMDHSFQTQAAHEMEGIIAATVQQASRSVALSVRQHAKPRVAYNLLSRIMRKIASNRINLLCNYFVVLLHNRGRLDEFEAAGITKLKTIPETLPAARVRHDHCQFKDLDLVNVLTAGDDLVCQDCEDYADSGPYDIDEIELPIHENCRCAIVPADDARFAAPELSEEWFPA